MGGGRLIRPDFGPPPPNPDHPLTEFYLLLQRGLEKEGSFALPGLWARFQAPARRIWPEEAGEYLVLSSEPRPGYTRLLAPCRMQLLYDHLEVTSDGAPAALVLTEAGSRSSCAAQLLPPFLWSDPLPPLPDVPRVLTVQLTAADLDAADRDSAALGRQLALDAGGKTWLSHPAAERWAAQRVAQLQRLYRR